MVVVVLDAVVGSVVDGVVDVVEVGAVRGVPPPQEDAPNTTSTNTMLPTIDLCRGMLSTVLPEKQSGQGLRSYFGALTA